MNEEERGLPALYPARSNAKDVLVDSGRDGERKERRANRVVQTSGRSEGIRLQELLGGPVPPSPELGGGRGACGRELNPSSECEVARTEQVIQFGEQSDCHKRAYESPRRVARWYQTRRQGHEGRTEEPRQSAKWAAQTERRKKGHRSDISDDDGRKSEEVGVHRCSYC